MAFEGKKCDSCGFLYTSNPARCNHCGSAELEPVLFSGRGCVYTYTTIHIPSAAFNDQVPFVVGLIDLEEGPRVTARLTLPDSRLKIGSEVFHVEQGPDYMVFG